MRPFNPIAISLALLLAASTAYEDELSSDVASSNFGWPSRVSDSRRTNLGHMQSQVYFPQNQNHVQDAQNRNQRQLLVPSSVRNPNEPANIPNVINQEDSRAIEQYMRNYNNEPVNGDRIALNLASINDRGPRVDRQKSPEPRTIPLHERQKPEQKHPPNTIQQRIDTSRSSYDISNLKKGQVADVALSKSDLVGNLFAAAQPKNLLNAASHKWETNNCLARSVPIVSRCEDHLIRRLNQDATEGRTVLDVGRRVCCALFWHKDCINRIVLDTCPDSSPAAADYLLGSRKLDLTLSCQKFNRDGCNGASLSSEFSVSILTASMIICIFLIEHHGWPL